MKRFDPVVLVVFLPFLFSGCSTLGPKTINSDRPIYDDQISESWKRQMLLNIVKLRYADVPTFLDVSSIIAQYGVEQQVNANVGVGWPVEPGSNSADVGGYYRYSDKPTITYTPLSGQKFMKNLLTPIPPMAVISMIQNGWAVDVVFSVCVKSVNGRQNYTGKETESKHQQFLRLVTLWRELQIDNVIDFRLEKTQGGEQLVCFITPEGLSDENRAKVEESFSILGLKPNEAQKYTVVFGKLPSNDSEIALLTRSMLEILVEMSALVEAPAEDIKSGVTKETRISGLNGTPLMRIHSGTKRPADAFVSIAYRDHWFWISDNDFASKKNFTMLMMFLSLTETDQKAGAGPLISI